MPALHVASYSPPAPRELGDQVAACPARAIQRHGEQYRGPFGNEVSTIPNPITLGFVVVGAVGSPDPGEIAECLTDGGAI